MQHSILRLSLLTAGVLLLAALGTACSSDATTCGVPGTFTAPWP